MKIDVFLKTIKQFPKPFYKLVDLEKIFHQDKITVQKSIERLVKFEVINRLMKDVYILADQPIDLTSIAAVLYQPSYLSFESVLFKHGIINQPPFGATFATTRRSKKLDLSNGEFWFSQIKPALWWGFELQDGIFTAGPEKAIVDMLYLKALGQRLFDTDEWYLKSIDKKILVSYLKKAGIPRDKIDLV
jgi:predicted transcriptional regulator of viral defense system